MNVGVLASHAGTTLQSLLDAFAAGRIPGRISVVVSNNGDSGALVKARAAGVRAVHLSSKTHGDPAALDAAIRDVLVAAGVDVVFLAGYMKKLGPFVLGTFQGRILNTHPALLPRFGGRGMFMRVNSKCAHQVRPPLSPWRVEWRGPESRRNRGRPNVSSAPRLKSREALATEHFGSRRVHTCVVRSQREFGPRRSSERQAPSRRTARRS